MNNLDKQYINLLQDILDNGVVKKDRTGTGTKSVFGRQIRHKMSEGFPLLTTKKMAWKPMVVELLWFLQGDTNIQYLVKNGCHIWDGDAYKRFQKTCQFEIDANHILPNEWMSMSEDFMSCDILSKEEFINKIKTDDKFAKKWGDLGPIYGKQWRKWDSCAYEGEIRVFSQIDQIQVLIKDLVNNPDSRRLMVTAWNPSDIPNQVLPPCHYGFQCYTTELTIQERIKIYENKNGVTIWFSEEQNQYKNVELLDLKNIPKRKLSLMWNQRSCDFPLGIPYNIASYGLLLIMLADEVNMIPDELIGNLGDCHIYLNQIDGVIEQIGRELTLDERIDLVVKVPGFDPFDFGIGELKNKNRQIKHDHEVCNAYNIPRRTREPFPLPTVKVQDGIYCSSVQDVILLDYQSHPKIYFPLSN